MTTLAELRQANLKEQNSPAPPPASSAAPATAPPDPAAPNASAPTAAASSPASASSAPASAPTSPPPASTNSPASAPPASTPDPAAASPLRLTVAATVPTDEMLRDTAFLARVREAMSRKVIHPTGSKATVDMEPALFHRAKRYCNEHGNISLRQVFLELLTVYLEEEGY